MQRVSDTTPGPSPGSRGGGPVLDLRFKLNSSGRAVRAALTELVREMHRSAFETEEIGTVQLVLAEVLNNIVEHGYPPPVPRGQISLHCALQDNGLHVDIRDQGRAMPDDRLPLGQGQPVNVDLDDLPEGGFGWFMIRDLAKDLRYDRVAGENRLRLRIAVRLVPVT